ncbi:MAG: cyclodeaminase/cyclohydrolase family protein [Candidatus Omnitrophica bacterium]|nr:cyclodeaminase/cyclohydrolase family protein [Candidatus Omnitrophota bacterium]
MYINQSLKKYLDDLADKKPTPGGGSAAALTSALGTALISMVCNFTIGKQKFRDKEEEINKILAENETLRQRFMELVDLDISAYEKVTQMRKLFKENKEIYEKKMQEAIREAVMTPLEVCQLSIQALKICKNLIDKINVNLISDLSVSTNLLQAGYQSALLNIEINLPFLKDRDFILEVRRILEPLTKESQILPNLILAGIKEEINKITPGK